MKTDMINSDQLTVDAKGIGALFDIDPANVQALMRAGNVINPLKTGIDEYADPSDLSYDPDYS